MVKPLVVVMGVTGSGKSTVGALLAERLAVAYAEADNFHPPGNIAKMSAGIPLDDEDRSPWLDTVGKWLADRGQSGGVVACSALRRGYRDRLREAAPALVFAHLDGSRELIAERLGRRADHFMPASLLRSQFDTLEKLGDEEPGVVVSIDAPPEEVADRAVAALSG